MTEYYNLPVLFTEEERAKYAEWGIKKSKLLPPMRIIVVLIDFMVTLGRVLYLLSLIKVVNVQMYLAPWGDLMVSISEGIAFFLCFIFIKPLDILFDKIYKKPQNPKMLRLEPTPQGVEYQLLRGKKVLSNGVLSWEEWQRIVYPNTNQIYIENQCLTIGANTIETIYPPDKQGKWMERPEEKIVGTINLGKIQKNMKSYLAYLEEQKKEKEWQKQNNG